MFENITKFVSDLGEITIEGEFIELRNWAANKFYPEDREEERLEIDCDALLLEYLLIKNKIVDEPQNWQHDFIYNSIKIDAKRVNSKYFNMSKYKANSFNKSNKDNELDYFCFFRELIQYDRPLQMGDKQKLEIIKFVPVREVLKQISRSNFNDRFYYIL